MLNAVLDAGINFIDTAPDYGDSEEFVGRFIAHRRSEFFLATKCGCPVAPSAGTQHVYNHENIVAAVEQSLRRMRTDHIDVLQFHGAPSPEALESEGAIHTLHDLQNQGKVRFIGVSSVLPELARHIAMGVFDTFQIPYSPLQREHEDTITDVARIGAGTIIRGSVVRGAPAPEKAWDIRRLPEISPERPRSLWERAQLDDLLDGETRMEFTLRFTFSHPDLGVAIIGTSNLEHLRANIQAFQKGPLPADVLNEAKRRLDAAVEDATE